MPIRNTFRNLGAGTKRFFESNTLVSKFAIVILVLIGFVFLLRLGIKAIQWLLSPTKSPYLFKGVHRNTKEMKIIPQNPAKGDSKTIVRSVNQRLGLEFTIRARVSNRATVWGRVTIRITMVIMII